MKITVKQLKQLIKETIEETATSLGQLEKMEAEKPGSQHSSMFNFAELFHGKKPEEIIGIAAELDPKVRADMSPEQKMVITHAMEKFLNPIGVNESKTKRK
jgi:hypothetical protein